VLPADVSAGATRRARFEQEAHAAAALNHPNIVHDTGSDNGVFYIATELGSGETLASIIGREPFPIRTVPVSPFRSQRGWRAPTQRKWSIAVEHRRT
jgi:hypothetical protein